LSTGEIASAALLGMALDEVGLPAVVLDPDRVGLEVDGAPLDAIPVTFDAKSVLQILKDCPVAVLPGFFGRTASGSPAILGRGGSDLTALFAALRLDAVECRLLKDVGALCSADPNGRQEVACRFLHASWEEALAVGGKLIQPKAIQFAQKHRMGVTVSAPLAAHKSYVGFGPQITANCPPKNSPLRVALLGLGSVGLGVYQRLRGAPDKFRIVGIAVRNKDKHQASGVSPELLVTDPWTLVQKTCDVVVELIGGLDPATALIETSLAAGRHIVTGNKAVIAREGVRLQALAQSRGVELKYSASVGGAVPVLEVVREVRRQREIRGISGVLNGTCNYVLDQLAQGEELPAAVAAAQREGFAEADPSLDLSGADSADKLAILARAAFGVDLHPSDISCQGIEEITSDQALKARSTGKSIRLIASSRISRGGIDAKVEPIMIPSTHPLGGAMGAENRVLIDASGGDPILLAGKGAGRWPTSLSVFADLVDLWCKSSASADTAQRPAGWWEVVA
jgi:homoserine dehydrogenase